MMGAGCWVLGAGCWMLDVGCWMLDAGYSGFSKTLSKYSDAALEL